MSDLLLASLLMGAFLYALGIGMTILTGLADYSAYRGRWANEEGKRKALRRLRRCLIWPTLYSLKPLIHFLSDLRRDLRRTR